MIRQLFSLARLMLQLKMFSTGDTDRISRYLLRRQAHKQLRRTLKEMGL